MVWMIILWLIRYLLGFLYPVSRLISYSVFEKVVLDYTLEQSWYVFFVSPKVVFYHYLVHLGFVFVLSLQEQKIREGLYMMGLKDEIFHLSWFITYALQAGFSCLNFDKWTFVCIFSWRKQTNAPLLSIYVMFFSFWYFISFLTRLCSAVRIVLWDYYSLYDGKSL